MVNDIFSSQHLDCQASRESAPSTHAGDTTLFNLDMLYATGQITVTL